MKKSQLKQVIKQIVREAIQEREYKSSLQEVSPPGKKSERQVMHVKKSLRKTHPEWDEEKITQVAIATAWKNKNKSKKKKKKKVNEAGLTSEDDGGGSIGYASGKVTGGSSEASDEGDAFGGGNESSKEGYSEEKELELISLIGKAVAKLLSMHKDAGMPVPSVSGDIDADDISGEEDEDGEEGEEGGEEESDSTPPQFAKKDTDDSDEEEEEEEVEENFKVQTGTSCRTANDSTANPKNVRNPKLG